ncbi:MAG TPA: zinc ribbon domain-containing protein [Candidatus Kapabacteria bacterium]|nr:zinc ribbon domain-containing protein [Candidatus Kapabacteria bacterium]
MPTYEYHCKKCGIDFEAFQGISEKSLEKCTEDVCPLTDTEKGTGDVERRISAGAGLMFKGSGFYITGYKSGTKPDSKPTGKSDTKPPVTPPSSSSGGSK